MADDNSEESKSLIPQLLQKEELFQLMIEVVRDYAIILMDPSGNVVSWNVGAERILGYREGEIIGRYFGRFFTPEDVQAGRPEHELKQAAEVEVVENECWMVRKDTTRFFSSGVTAALRENGLRGYAKIFRDLTERRRLEEEVNKRAEELADAHRRKDEFLAMLSHELRNPLAPIMNALQILRQDRSENPVTQRARSMIERQVRQMTRLVDDLLDVSRITQGKVQLHKEQVELSVVPERAVETTKSLIEARRQELIVTVPTDPIWLEADPARLEQIVSNLLNNAAKYTEPGGRIWLVAPSPQSGRAVVRVRDTGAGISSELLPRIFDMFTQAERTLDRSHGGLGVGLTLVKSLVEMHGGTIIAHSMGLGKGSEFTVELPTIPEPVARLDKDTGMPEQKTGYLRVLVVDDNMDTAESLATLLTLQGYEARTANDGIKALQTAPQFRPDVILLDIGLPGADGYQLAQRLRQHRDLKDVVLVAITGYGQDADRERSRRVGFDYHLVKPTRPEVIQELLAMLANRPRAR